MDAIYLLIPIALILVAIGVAIFFWAVKSDQFEDLEGPAHSILFDDDKNISKQTNKNPPEHDSSGETTKNNKKT